MISDPAAERRVVVRVGASVPVSTAANTTGLTMSYSSTKKYVVVSATADDRMRPAMRSLRVAGARGRGISTPAVYAAGRDRNHRAGAADRLPRRGAPTMLCDRRQR